MADGDRSWGSWRSGCLVTLSLLLLVVAVAVGAVGVAIGQNRSAENVAQSSTLSVGPVGQVEPTLPAAGTEIVEIDVLVAEAIVVPALEGQAIRIDADFDPREYRLDQQSTERDGALVHRISLRPRGNASWALLRARVGRELPILRVELPVGIALSVAGHLQQSFMTVELGGLDLTEASFDVEASGLKLSFVEPTVAPVERLRIEGSKGAVEISGLGNASPLDTQVQQRLGGIDLDLRGAWRQDAQVALRMSLTGGTLWLPRNVDVTGAGAYRRWKPPPTEIPRPTLRLDLPEGSRSLIVIE